MNKKLYFNKRQTSEIYKLYGGFFGAGESEKNITSLIGITHFDQNLIGLSYWNDQL